MNVTTQNRISTGVAGLDEILAGGLIPQRRYLVRGAPGTGKTTLGMSFLAEGVRLGEAAMFIGFQESEAELRANFAPLGIDVSGITFLGLAPDETFFTQSQTYDVFSAADVEQAPLVDAVLKGVEGCHPRRVFVDSLTQLRFLSADMYQYRKQAMSFLQYLVERGATVMFSSESSADFPDDDLQFLSDGVIKLESAVPTATVEVSKFRGSARRPGKHELSVDERGFHVFPRLLPPLVGTQPRDNHQWHSGVEALDRMLGGGLEDGTVSMITGPTGIGKSTLAALFAVQAARQGYAAAIYLFEEESHIYTRRLRALGVDIDAQHEAGRLLIEQVEPLVHMADEFAARLREELHATGAKVVILDSVGAFELALRGRDTREAIHAFAKALARMGVSVILVNETAVGNGGPLASERALSYLADNIMYMNYRHTEGVLSRSLGVLKKRLSGFDPAVHGFEIGPGGIVIGSPVANDSANATGGGDGRA